jgi:hypothetical protein
LVQIGTGRAPSIADGIAEYVNVSHGSVRAATTAVKSLREARGLAPGARASQAVDSATVDILTENPEMFVPKRPVETVSGADADQRLEAELFAMFRVQDGRVWRDIRQAFVPRYSEKKVRDKVNSICDQHPDATGKQTFFLRKRYKFDAGPAAKRQRT